MLAVVVHRLVRLEVQNVEIIKYLALNLSAIPTLRVRSKQVTNVWNVLR